MVHQPFVIIFSLLAMYDTYIKLSRCIMKEIDFASYSVLSVSPSRLVAALGNINGLLRLLSWNGKFLGDYCKCSKVLNNSCMSERPSQTEQTQIRLLLKKQSDQGLPCLLFGQFQSQ